ncbi:MAG: hypothetical protein U1F43_17835 [Myxococcota bacterium]
MRRFFPALALLVAAGSALGGAACDDGPDTLADFRSAFPDETTLAVTLPDDDGTDVIAAGLGMTEGALVGQTSQMRVQTALARRFIGRTLGEMLDSFRDTTASRPTIQRKDRVVWFGHGANGAEHLLVAARQPDGHFVFTAWIRDRLVLSQRPPWRFLAFGSLTPGHTLGNGRGALWIDLDNDRKPVTKGKVVILFAEHDGVRDLDIKAFDAAADNGDPLATRGYHFHEDARGGTFAFDNGIMEVKRRQGQPTLAAVRFVVRWNAVSQVRADATATSDDIRADGFRALVGSECWKAKEGIVLFAGRVGIAADSAQPTVIDASGAPGLCPFARPAIPVLPEPTDPPAPPDGPPETDPNLDWET